MTLAKGGVTVVLPALNEEEVIGPAIEELQEEGFENLLVVDGYSEDATVEISKKRVAEVIYQKGEGKAKAVQTGISEVETPFLVLVDADWIYPAKGVQKLLEKPKNQSCVIVKRVNLFHCGELEKYLLTP